MTDMVRCLILEQDEPTINQYKNCIPSSYQVYFISDASELLQKIVSYSPALVILNIQYVPKFLSVIHTIKKTSPLSSIVITTKQPNTREAISCMRYGTSDYLELPFSEEDLSFLLSQASQKYKSNISNVNEQKNKLNFVGDLAAEVAHDIKTPLSCIHGFINLYLKLLYKENISIQELQNSKHYLEQSISEVERCKKILNNLLLFSQKENFTYFKLWDIVNEISLLLVKDFESIQTKLQLDVAPSLQVYGNPDKIYQVLLNLIVNAKNATANGVIHVSAQIKENVVKITVQDNGKGIEQEDLQKIFIPFYTKTQNGNGLGLSIAKKIVEEHKGKIHVTSVVNQGSTFIIELPTQ